MNEPPEQSLINQLTRLHALEQRLESMQGQLRYAIESERPVASADEANLRQQLAAARQEYDRLATKEQTQREQLTKLRSDHDKLVKRLAEAERDLAATEGRNAALMQLNAQLVAERDSHASRALSLASEYQQQSAAIAEIANLQAQLAAATAELEHYHPLVEQLRRLQPLLGQLDESSAAELPLDILATEANTEAVTSETVPTSADAPNPSEPPAAPTDLQLEIARAIEYLRTRHSTSYSELQAALSISKPVVSLLIRELKDRKIIGSRQPDSYYPVLAASAPPIHRPNLPESLLPRRHDDADDEFKPYLRNPRH